MNLKIFFETVGGSRRTNHSISWQIHRIAVLMDVGFIGVIMMGWVGFILMFVIGLPLVAANVMAFGHLTESNKKD